MSFLDKNTAAPNGDIGAQVATAVKFLARGFGRTEASANRLAHVAKKIANETRDEQGTVDVIVTRLRQLGGK